MKLYNIFYIDNSKQKHYEATTDNFHKWLKDHNDNREKGYEDDEDDYDSDDDDDDDNDDDDLDNFVL